MPPIPEAMPVTESVTENVENVRNPEKAVKLIAESVTKLPKLYAAQARATAAIERACDALSKAQERHRKVSKELWTWEVINGCATDQNGHPFTPEYFAKLRVRAFNSMT